MTRHNTYLDLLENTLLVDQRTNLCRYSEAPEGVVHYRPVNRWCTTSK